MLDLDALMQRIAGRITDFMKPEKCWLWTGASTKAGPRMQMMRDRDRIPFFQPVVSRPFGIVKVDGRRRPVHKLVYEWLTPEVMKSPKYRLYNDCGNSLCCNPSHWILKDPAAGQFAGQQEGKSAEEIQHEARLDCLELLESLLATTQPRCFSDIEHHPYMVDFQPKLIKEVLSDIGKEHLCD
jgi:hypothetical protein